MKVDQRIEEGRKDPLYGKAVDVVLKHRRGSVSLVQRKLGITYGRADMLVNAMVGAILVEPPPTAKFLALAPKAS